MTREKLVDELLCALRLIADHHSPAACEHAGISAETGLDIVCTIARIAIAKAEDVASVAHNNTGEVR